MKITRDPLSQSKSDYRGGRSTRHTCRLGVCETTKSAIDENERKEKGWGRSVIHSDLTELTACSLDWKNGRRWIYSELAVVSYCWKARVSRIVGRGGQDDTYGETGYAKLRSAIDENEKNEKGGDLRSSTIYLIRMDE